MLSNFHEVVEGYIKTPLWRSIGPETSCPDSCWAAILIRLLVEGDLGTSPQTIAQRVRQVKSGDSLGSSTSRSGWSWLQWPRYKSNARWQPHGDRCCDRAEELSAIDRRTRCVGLSYQGSLGAMVIVNMKASTKMVIQTTKYPCRRRRTLYLGIPTTGQCGATISQALLALDTIMNVIEEAYQHRQCITPSSKRWRC